MQPTTAVLFNQAATAAMLDAVKRWRAEYAPSASYESILAENANSVEVKGTVRSMGRINIRVVVDGKRRGTYDTYFYEGTLSAGELKLESLNA